MFNTITPRRTRPLIALTALLFGTTVQAYALPESFSLSPQIEAPTAVENIQIDGLFPTDQKGVGDPTGMPTDQRGLVPAVKTGVPAVQKSIDISMPTDQKGLVPAVKTGLPAVQKSINFSMPTDEKGLVPAVKTGPDGTSERATINFSRGAITDGTKGQADPPGGMPTDQKSLNFTKGQADPPGVMPTDQKSLNFTKGTDEGIIVDWTPGAAGGEASGPIYMNQGGPVASPEGTNGAPIFMNQGGAKGTDAAAIYMNIGAGAQKGGNSGVPIYMNEGAKGGGGTNSTPIFMNQAMTQNARGAAALPGALTPGTTSAAPIFMNQGALSGVPIFMNQSGGGGGAGVPALSQVGNGGVPIFMNQGGSAAGRSQVQGGAAQTGGGGGAGFGAKLNAPVIMFQH